jgi:hypothetical protein
MFKYELDLISMCNMVVTISTEETFLMRNLGMTPVYLPYFPLKQTADRLGKVRKCREGIEKVNFLLLGTVYNFPTLEGMKRVITAITCHNVLHDDKLIVAGYGTRELLGHIDDSRVELRGDVTDVELDELMTTVKGCLVYQDTGSGALTKIPELLTAGVPVIINSHAARSYHNLPGVFEFNDFGQLSEKMDAAAKVTQFPQALFPPDPSTLQKLITELAGL